MIDSYDYKGHNLVFVVGCPRSGTTWLQRLLICHPLVRTGQESKIFSAYVGPQLQYWRRDSDPKKWGGRGGVGLECYFREEEFLNILRDYMLNLLEPMTGNLQAGELFLEKTPSHALFIPEIMELLPEIRVIHILRDARDVVASILAASTSWGENWAPDNARVASKMWIRYVKAVREAAAVLSTTQYIEVFYEGLHADTLGVLRILSQFLGLKWDETGIREAVEQNKLEVARKGGGTAIRVGGEAERISGSYVREPQGFIRRGCPGGWREDLSWIDKFWVWRRAHRTMDEVGYHWDFPWFD